MVEKVDRLQRADHHLEVGDETISVEGDDVDAVDFDAVDFVDEFEDGAVVALPFADIFEAGPPSTLPALVKYLKVMSRPRCGVCTTGLSKTTSGWRSARSSSRSWLFM